MWGQRIWVGLVLSFLLGLSLVGWYFRNALNTDAVAYLRIASYYATGKVQLAISGYWGPLLSWLMALPIKAGLTQLAVARGAMAFSALVFLGGSVAAYRAFELPQKWVLTGAILSSVCGLYWSVRFITPDLLLGGLVGLAVSAMIRGEDSQGALNELLAGGLWGLAFLAKAVAFPVAILTALSLAGPHFFGNGAERRLWVRKTLFMFIGFCLIAGPWLVIISLKYGRPTISTSARISHALTGPADVERYHPFALRLHRPERGRVTSWEEPSSMAYRYWSPLASPAYALHQLKVLALNFLICLVLLTSLEVVWLLPLFDLVLKCRPKLAPHAASPIYLRALIVPVLLVLLYLPTSVNLAEQRFFYPAFPFLFASVALWANRKAQNDARASLQFDQTRRWWLAILGVAVPLVGTIILLGASPKYAGDCAVKLASRIKHARLTGPVAGSGLVPGGRAGLYVAFLLNQPWYGDELHPTPGSFEDSSARLVVVVRRSTIAQSLARDPNFVNCDARLFDDPQQSARFPLQVFELRDWQAGASR